MAVKNGAYSLEEKREAVAYFNKNEVPKRIEQLLNKMFKEKPSDIFGYMAEYFGSHSQAPTISKVSAENVLSCRGFPSFQLSLNCTINGLSKHVASVASSVDASPLLNALPAKVKTPDAKTKTPDLAKQQKGADVTTTSNDGELSNDNKGLDVEEMIERIDVIIGPIITGLDPTDQTTVDEILQKLEEQEKAASKVDSSENIENETEEDADADKGEGSQIDSRADTSKKPSMPRGESKQSHTSQETSKKTDSKKQSTKESVTQVIPDLDEEVLCTDCAMIGVSMATAITGAKIKGAPLYEHLAFLSGKKAVRQLTNIHQQMTEILVQKYGQSARCITDDGSYSPSMDKPEQALDFVQEAVSSCGYSLGTDIHIALNCAASEFYDQEKQKYEIMANTFKSLDDVINLFCELHDRYPGIIAIVDGVRSPDKEGWKKLNQRIGEKCFIVGNDLFRKHASVLEYAMTEKLSSVAVLSLDQANTITGLAKMAKTVADQGGLLALKEGPCSDPSSILVDLAVAFGARFIRLGGPVRAEHVSKYRRLQQIEEELEQRGILASREQHVFPVINVVQGEDGGDEEK
ncbi:enolase 4-like isoform X2 [Porites lutea]|uniref:enolase 4-like isoform X2 n=1 Tax=Porites lutea TaxID=51062 RepID=UPI003CC54040